MKKRLIKLIALAMCAAMLTGCAASGGVKNLTDGVNAADVTLPEVTDYTMIGDLGAGLMQYAAAQEAENPVLSPLSAYLCLSGSWGLPPVNRYPQPGKARQHSNGIQSIMAQCAAKCKKIFA